MAHETDQQVVLDWIAEVMQPAELLALVERINLAIAAQVAVFDADPGLQLDLTDNTRSQVEAFLSYATGRPDVETPWAALALARSFARRGLELEQLLRVYRIGLSTAQQYLASAVGPVDGRPALPAAQAVQLITKAGEWLDRSVEHLSAAYEQERQRWLGGELTVRTETVQAVLRGTEDDAGRATAALGHPMHLDQLAVTLWGAERMPLGTFDTLAQRLGSAVGAASVLTVPAGERGAWVWLAGATTGVAAALADLLARVDPSLRAATGSTATGLPGFRRSHDEALAAQRLVARAGREDAVTCYPEVELVCLVSADLERMRAFVTRELGGLAGGDEGRQRLRETVLCSLLHGPAGAGRRLHVHTNTVRYRVGQAEALLGRPVGSRPHELVLALRCAGYFGPAASGPRILAP